MCVVLWYFCVVCCVCCGMFVLFVVCVVLWHFVLCVLCVFCVVSSRDCAPLVLLCFLIVRGIGLESGLGLVDM